MTAGAWDVPPADLRDFVPAWRDLWRCARADPFQHPAWLMAWWEVFAPGDAVVLAVGPRGRPRALAPLWREPGTGRLLPFGVGPGDRTDVLVDPAADRVDREALARAVAEAARTSGVCWPDAPPDGAVVALEPPPGWTRHDGAGTPCPVLDLAPGAAAVPSGRWRKWRMAGHRAGRRGAVRFVPAGDYGVDAFADLLVRLNSARFGSADGVFADGRMVSFARRALAALQAEGVLDGEVLLVGGEEAAIHVGLRTGSCAFGWLGGFDEAFSFESPGTLLTGRAIRRAIEAGATRFDFLRGTEPYKHGWGARDVPNRVVSWSADD